MSTLLHRQLTIVVIVALLAPIVAQAGRHPLNEDSAVNLLLRTLEHDNVYKERISLDCVLKKLRHRKKKTNARRSNLSSGKITPRSAAATLKPVP